MGEVVSLTARKEAGARERRKKKKGGEGPPPGELDELSRLVRDLNSSYALVLVGNTALVLHETQDSHRRPMLAFYNLASFKAWHAKKRVPDYEKGEMAGLGDLWLKHPERREYHGVAFRPRCWNKEKWDFEPDDLPGGWYNLWTGFSVRPADPLPDPREHVRYFKTLYDHVRRNVAGGRDDLARWVWGWHAHMLQKPTERLGTALITRGKRGAGKSTIGDAVGSLLGQHYTLIDDPKHLVGNFNAHMANCLLLQADEGFWAGDKTAEGKLKSLITSKVHLIERKGVDAVQVDNYVHLFVSSNEDWVVPAGMEERRWAVLDVGNGNLQDRPFFKQLNDELDNGGREHLLAWLLRFDLDKVDVATIPNTIGLYDQKMASLEPHVSWWFDCLQRGAILYRQKEWPELIPTDALYKSYTDYVEQLGRRNKKTKQELGIVLRELATGIKVGKAWVERPVRGPNGELVRTHDSKIPRERVPAYRMPGLHMCRTTFEKLIRWPVPWPDEELNERPVALPGSEQSGATPPDQPTPPDFDPTECPF